ncbi:MAG: c-type cytochrome [Rhodanobacter sp.]
MTHFPPWRTTALRWLAGVLLVLGSQAGAAWAADARPIPDTLQQRIAACTTCHGVHGEGRAGSKFFPRLAGKPAGYLARQMQDFQLGLRKYAPMEYMTRHLTPEYMREIAEYFSAQEVAYVTSPAPAVSEAVLRRGQILTTQGDAQLRVPACSACHGTDLVGVEPSTPALVGLPYDYISSQLGSWRTHTRATVQPDCMALVASRLRDSDITAVAAWLASRQMPAQTRPQPAGSVRPPLPCGVLGAHGEGA